MYNIHINPNVPNQSSLPPKVNEGIREVSVLSLQLDSCLYSTYNLTCTFPLKLSACYVAPLRYMWLEELVNIETYSLVYGWKAGLTYV